MKVSTSSPLRLTDAQVGSFQRDGFLRIDAITDDAEVETLLGIYDELFSRDGRFEAGDRIELSADVARAPLPQVVNPERYAPRLIQGPAWRNAREIARQVLGAGCVPTGNHAILKPPRIGGATPWHQDEAYWDARYAHCAVSVWLALQPATLENGCMRFIAGSHRGPVLPHELISSDSHGLRLSAPAPDDPETVCELPAAGATIHHGRTLHCAGPNLSASPRRALVFGFGLAPVLLETPNRYPWQRVEWNTHAATRSAWTR
ncbi:MAG: phytanoyl-CoA dioxygenase family protein [Steroidobacteraceae bacterium]